MKSTDCIIIGAGLSGLACALTLKKAGKTFQIFEASNSVGGRVRTQGSSDGFLYDEGFQVLLSSYPELKNFVELSALNLQKFNSGALIYQGPGQFELLANPLVHPETVIGGLSGSLATVKDQFLVLKLMWKVRSFQTDSVANSESTETYLNKFGFSPKFIEYFWRPFLTGVYLDESLSLPSDFFQFLLRCFQGGEVTIPLDGMQQLPMKMAEALPAGSIQLNKKVSSFGHDHIILESGERIETTQVICAADFKMLHPQDDQLISSFRSVTTYYFTGEGLSKIGWGKWLVLIPKEFGFKINHLCLLSEVSTGYSLREPLLSVSLVGKKSASVEGIMAEIAKIAGQKIPGLRHLKTTEVPYALPKVHKEASGFVKIDGVIHCGDRWASPSINGALRSGRMAAEAALAAKIDKTLS